MRKLSLILVAIAALGSAASAESFRTSDGVQCITSDKGWGKVYGEVDYAETSYGETGYNNETSSITLGFEVPLSKKPEGLDCTNLLRLEEKRLELELMEKMKSLELMDAQIALTKKQTADFGSAPAQSQPGLQIPSQKPKPLFE